MELPHLGQQCSEPTCKQLDFLPIECDACHEIFCQDHFQSINHNCKNAYTKDNLVPVCPLCNKPIPLKYGESADAVVGSHIDNDCQSDPARERRKIYIHRCTFKGCKTKEGVPIVCKYCKQNFCVKHRFHSDHNCTEVTSFRENIQSNSVFLNPSKDETAQTSSTVTNNIQEAIQGNISEDEAFARALSLSLNEKQTPTLTQEELDFALARQLQEEQNQQPTAMVGGARPNRDRCNVS